MPEEKAIRVLSDSVINKIAAGEVVDRPASVVKELVENAIDAGSRNITVSVVDGGLKLISVSDDGSGMSRDNALLSVERHATSKITSADDIERISSLGFRGEALAAIASVSRFELVTRRVGDLSGTAIRINGGKIEDVCEAGSPPGTTFNVRQLFYNMPARRKFLKSAATELNHIRQAFLLYAMGRPDIGLRLVVDEREIYRLDPDSQLEDRIRQLFGPAMMPDLKTVDWVDDTWSIRGLASSPKLTRSDRAEQYIFVNGRPAMAPVVGFAISEAYANIIPRGRYPVLFLFIELPPDEVDVNVHPTKKEVRFRHSGRIRDGLMAAIHRAFVKASDAGSLLTGSQADQSAQVGASVPAADFISIPDIPVLPAFQYPAKGEPAIPGSSGEAMQGGAAASPKRESMLAGKVSQSPWQWCRILGQISNYFVVLETDEGMLLLDPQAAHERVIYENLQAGWRKRKVPTQGLLVPETVQLAPVKAGFIRKYLSSLEKLGFGISEFGGDTFMVESMPSVLGHASAAMVLDDIAADLELSGKSISSEDIAREHIMRISAQMAVRTTTQLTREALEHLVSELVLTELPYTSPRGRPTVIFTSIQEIRKKFGRE